MPEIKNVCDDFVTMRISLERKSRKEFVDAHKSDLQNKQGSGFFNGIGQMFGGNR
jgi:hypothetical protein